MNCIVFAPLRCSRNSLSARQCNPLRPAWVLVKCTVCRFEAHAVCTATWCSAIGQLQCGTSFLRPHWLAHQRCEAPSLRAGRVAAIGIAALPRESGRCATAASALRRAFIVSRAALPPATKSTQLALRDVFARPRPPGQWHSPRGDSHGVVLCTRTDRRDVPYGAAEGACRGAARRTRDRKHGAAFPHARQTRAAFADARACIIRPRAGWSAARGPEGAEPGRGTCIAPPA